MSAPKRGLGRGLGALLGETSTGDVTGKMENGVNGAPIAASAARAAIPELPIARVRANPHQPRKIFDDAALEDLRASIAAFGILVPVLVRERGDGYELIAGERRWRAAKLAGLTTIPAIVRSADDRESAEVAIIENLQRENLDPLEEAMGFAHLMETYDFTQEHLAERIGRSRSAVANALRLLSLSDEVKHLVRAGRLTAGHARAVLMLPPERREAAARRAADEGMSVRALERLAQAAAPRKTRAAAVARAGEADDYVQRLRYRYATHVRVAPQGNGGTIEFRFADASELLRIVDLLLGEHA